MSDKKIILLIEDDAFTAMVERKILEANSYEVIIAKNGEEASEKISAEIDLVLMDINLGAGMDGFETAKLILEKYDIPLIFLLSELHDDYIEKAESITNYGFVLKSSGEKMLLAAIKMALKLYREKQRAKDQILFQQALHNTIPSPIYYKDLNGSYIDCNKAYEEYIGKPASEIIGKNIFDIVTEKYAKFFNKLDKELIENGENQVFEAKIELKNGEIRDGLFYKALIYDFNNKPIGIVGTVLDITDSKCLQKDLKESEERFKALHEGSFAGIIIHDKGKIVLCNETFSELSGYSMDELIGRNSLDFIAEESKETVIKKLTTGYPEPYEAMAIKKNGERIIIRIHGKNINYKDKVLRVTEIRDITQEKRIIETNNALSVIINNSLDIAVLKDVDLKYLVVNQAYLNLTGYRTLDEVIGKNDAELFKDKASDAEIKEYFENDLAALKLQKNEFISKEETLGTETYLTRKFPIFDNDNNLVAVSTISSNITERKNLENKLLEQKNILESIINALPGLLSVVDLYRNIIVVNKARLENSEFAGYSQIDSFIGHKCHECYYNQEQPCANCQVDNVFKNGEITVEVLDSNDGRFKHTNKVWKLIVAPIKNHNNEITGAVEYAVDITDLHEAIKKAEKANKAKSEFLANMSHEIRTPLNGVIGFSDLLMDTSLDDIQWYYLENIQTSSHTLLALINDVLDFSKIEAGKLEFDIVKTNIYAVVDEIKRVVSVLAEKKKIKLIYNIDENIPDFIYVDSIRFKQVITNLLSNSIKFTERGEVVFSLKFKDVSTNDSKKGLFSVSVKDTGIGISDEQKSKLFKAFTQADGSITRKYGGTGLGLVISNKIVEKMGSVINIDSELGVGSNFYFDFEANFEFGKTDRKKFSHPEQIQISEFSFKIMITEDVPMNMVIAKKQIQKLLPKVIITEAKNGLEAVHFAEKEKFDLIFMDVQMPVMDGLTATKEIRKHTQNESTIIVGLTAASFSEDIQKCLDAGMDDYVSKPINRIVLAEKINNYLDLKKEIINMESDVEKIIHFDEPAFRDNMYDDKEVMVEILNTALIQLEDYIVKYELSVNKQDYENARKIAHSVKGAAANLNFYYLTDLTKQAGEIIREEKYHELSNNANLIKNEWNIIKDIVENFLQN